MTQPRPIPYDIKIQTYFWPGTVKEIAAFLSHWYGQKCCAAQLIDAWDEEAQWNLLLRPVRPYRGFPQDDKVSLARMLVAA